MKYFFVLSALIFSLNSEAAFLPYLKVECRDVEGVFSAKDTKVVFELQETKTGNLEYTAIDTEQNGRIGFKGNYYTNFYKLKPDGEWGDLANEGRLKLVSTKTDAEVTLPNCRVLDR